MILDNFSNAKDDVPARLKDISGKQVHVYQGDVLDRTLLDDVFATHKIDGVVHFAAKKAVGESVAKPLDYIHTNVGGLLNLLAAMDGAGVRRIVFYPLRQCMATPTCSLFLRITRALTHRPTCSRRSQVSRF